MEPIALHLESPWHEVKERIKETHPELTDEDLNYQPGKENILLERLSKKMGKDIPTVKAWIESVSYNNGVAG
jgi:hypothetical protein